MTDAIPDPRSPIGLRLATVVSWLIGVLTILSSTAAILLLFVWVLPSFLGLSLQGAARAGSFVILAVAVLALAHWKHLR